MSNAHSAHRQPGVPEALAVTVVISVLLYIGIGIWHAPTTVVLLLAAATAAVYAVTMLSWRWDDLQSAIVSSIGTIIPALLILLTVGALIGVWMQSGTVPIMIYYGLKFLPPKIFLVAVALVSCIVSVATGTSWGTLGTVGVAFMGIAAGMGIPLPLAAGAVVVGAFFGDKMSPLSDTTNLAAAVSEVDLFDHVKHMLWTTGPALLISLVLFWILGARYGGSQVDTSRINEILTTLSSSFHLTPLLLIPPAVVILLVVLRKPVLPALVIGTVLAGLFAVTVQGSSIADVLSVMNKGFVASTGNKFVDNLVSRGGINSMVGTMVLCMAAVILGAVLRHTGILAALLEAVVRVVRSSGSLILTTMVVNMGIVLFTGSTYVSMSLAGPMLGPLYDRLGLHRMNLSRTLEDTGTVFVPLVPWSITGVFTANTLGVEVLAYAPYAFMCYLSMVFALIYGFTGYGIARASSGRAQDTLTGGKAVAVAR